MRAQHEENKGEISLMQNFVMQRLLELGYTDYIKNKQVIIKFQDIEDVD